MKTVQKQLDLRIKEIIQKKKIDLKKSQRTLKKIIKNI